MRGLLIVLCSIVTAAAALAGGCGLLVTTLLAGAAQKREDVAGLLLIAMPVLAVTGAVALVNMALITAIANRRAPRRTIWFLLLAVVDLVLAGILVAGGFAGRGPVNPGDASTLLLPAEPPRMPPPQ
jgi:ABC-type multidrug transport system permease subunit